VDNWFQYNTSGDKESVTIKTIELNGIQKTVLIITAFVLLYLSFTDSDIHLANIVAIISASMFLIYGLGQLQVNISKIITYQNLKRLLYVCLLIVGGISTIVASMQVVDAYKAKADYARTKDREAKKTPEEKAQEAMTYDAILKQMKTESDKKIKEDTEIDKLFKKAGVQRSR
jgi:hypothetical protein